MDREAVMAMTDDELRIKASELTGEWYTCSMEDDMPCGLAYRFPHEADKGFQELPKYHNDIDAAMKLWDALSDKFSNLSLHQANGWGFTVWDETPDGADNTVGPIPADTSVKAITATFIMAMTTRKESDEKEPMIRPD